MPEGFELGKSFITVEPDSEGFKPKLQADLDADKTTVKVDVEPNVDNTDFRAKIHAAMSGDNGTVKVGVSADTAKFKGEVDTAVLEADAKHVSITVDTNKSQLDAAMKDAGSGAGNVFTDAFKGAFGGSGGGSGGAGAAADAAGSPAGIVGIVTAGLVALPFIAQTAAAGIVAAFGTALAGMAIAGAFQSAKVKSSFSDLESSATKDLGQIGVSFIPVMTNIFDTASSVLGKLTPVFAAAAKVISGPFTMFSDALIKTFDSPAVKTSIAAVATSFGDILKAVTPQLGSDMNLIAGAVTNIADSIAAHPAELAAFIHGLVEIAAEALNMIAALSRVAAWVEANWDWFKWVVVPEVAAIQAAVAGWNTFQHEVAVIFDGIRAETAVIWGDIYGATIGVAIRIGHDVETQFNSLKSGLATAWNDIYSAVDTAWGKIANFFSSWWDKEKTNFTAGVDSVKNALSTAWDAISGAVKTAWDAITSFFTTWWNTLKSDFTTAVDAVKNALSSAWDTIKSDISTTWDAITSFFSTWWGKLKTDVSNDVATIRTTLSHAWDDIKSDAVTAWDAISGAIGTAFKAVENAVKTPVNWVLQNVIDKADGFFNKIPGVNLPTNLSLASGGKILAGTTPTADDVPALLSKDETVVSAAHSALLAPVFKAVGVPGYAAGGIPSAGRGGALNPAGPIKGYSGPTPASILTAGWDALKNLSGDALKSAATALINAAISAIPGSGTAKTMAKGLATEVSTDLINYVVGKANAAAAASTAAAGSANQNGATIFKYLMANAHMTPIAAAGAIASIYGESGWNPLAQGTGGRGLIGWTPPGTLPDSAFIPGNPTASLDAQLPAIIRFIGTSGDWGVISEMNKATSIDTAAQEWGTGVERYGINDVHPAGLALAAQILAASQVSGVKLSKGGIVGRALASGGIAPGGQWSLVGEDGPELINPSSSATVLPNGKTQAALGQKVEVVQYFTGMMMPTPEQLAMMQLQMSAALAPYAV